MEILHRRPPIRYADVLERMYLVDYNDYSRGDITFGFEVIRSRDDGCPGWFVLLPFRYTPSWVCELKRMISNHYNYGIKLLIVHGRAEQYQDYRYGIRMTFDRIIDSDPILHIHTVNDITAPTIRDLADIYKQEEENANYTKDRLFVTSASIAIDKTNCRFTEMFDEGTGFYHMLPVYTGTNPLCLRLIRTDSGAYRIMMPNFITPVTFDYLQSFLAELLRDDNYPVFVKAKSTGLSPSGLSEVEKTTAEFIYDVDMNSLIQKSVVGDMY